MKDGNSAFERFVADHTYIPELITWSKGHSLPGLPRVSIFRIVVETILHLRNANIQVKSSAITFNFILAFFPFTIFLITLLPYFQIDNAFELLKSSIGGLMPVNVEAIIFGLIEDTIRPRGGLLSLGFLAAMFFASNGILSLMRSFDDTELIQPKQSPWYVKRLKALLLTFLMIILLVVSVITFVLANQILAIVSKYITIDYLTRGFILSVRWIPVFLIIYILLTVIYRIGPTLRRKIPIISFATLLVTFLIMMTSLIISNVVDDFSNYNKIYGSLGTAVALMIWLQANMLLVLFGYEFNLVTLRHRPVVKKKKKVLNI